MASDRVTSEIRKWLLQSPRPASVRVITVDDETHDFAVPANVRWATLAASVAAVDPAMLQALSASGAIERAVKVSDWEPSVAPQARPSFDPAPEPQQLPESLIKDPHMALLAMMARLLADAHKFSTGVAFDKMVEIVGLLTRRMDELERKADMSQQRYQDEVYDRIQDMLDDAYAAKDGGKDSDSILATFANAVSAGRNGHAPPNGAGRPPRRRKRAQA